MTTHRDFDTILAAWTHGAIAKVTPGNSVHIHVDELLTDADRNPQVLLTLIASAYIRVIALMGNSLTEVMPVLVIPLKDAEHLVCEPPHVSGLSGNLAAEPPSISLVHRDTARLPRTRESYRRVLSDFELFDPPIVGVKLFYECSRSEEERLHGWEYARTIFAEHYPEFLAQA
jgi:hypothetical protein